MSKGNITNILSHNSIFKFGVNNILFVLCVTNIFLSSQFASAALIAQNDPQFGPGTIIYDTETGLDWLQPHWSRNRSYNDIVTDNLNDAPYQDFHHATYSEVTNLFTTAGLSLQPFPNPVYTPGQDPNPEDIARYLAAKSFVDMFGPPTLVRELPSGPSGILQHWERVAGFTVSDDGQQIFTAYVDYAVAPESRVVTFVPSVGNFRTESIGNWLVRKHDTSPVPEPTTGMLLGIGVTGLAVLRKRIGQDNPF